MNLANEARLFLRSTRHGILSTNSSKFPGYPFGSVAPFVTNHQAEPVILISTLAEHTKNILADPRVSLLVFSGEEDLQANARLTLIGEVIQADKNDADLRARYLRYLPQSANYFDMHDFSFYRIHIAQVRYIAGFGKMGWIDGDALLASDFSSASNQLASQEVAIVEHMNKDHADSLCDYCRYVHNIETEQAEMLGIDSDGFDVKVTHPGHESQIVRINFANPIHDAQSARAALVQLSKESRS